MCICSVDKLPTAVEYSFASIVLDGYLCSCVVIIVVCEVVCDYLSSTDDVFLSIIDS